MKQGQNEQIKGLYVIIFFLIVIIIFSVRIYHLQTPKQRQKALIEISKQNIRTIILYPDRGFIFDRNGNVLASNKYFFKLYAVPYYLNDTMNIPYLAHLLNLDTTELNQKLKPLLHTTVLPYKPRLIAEFIDQQHAGFFLEKKFLYPGLYLLKYPVRYYPAHVAAHALGYLSKVNKYDIQRDHYYKLNDMIGRTGLEAYYEKYLRGKKGVERWLITSTGRVVGRYLHGLTDTLPVAGKPLYTSIDLRLQRYAQFLMKNKPGALVAIEPKTGQILAYVSSPTFDPNLLTGKNFSKNFVKLNKNRILAPLMNRPIRSWENPPGSTFKVIQALVAQQLKVINTKTVFICNGGFFYHGISIHCHHHNPIVNFYYSIQTSCNTYYCNVFLRVINNPAYNNQHKAYAVWRHYVMQFGLGKPLGIDIPGEKGGSLPDTTTLSIALKKHNWGFPDIVHMAIGQGKIGITPLQLANVAATVANRGYYITPHFGIKIGDSILSYPKHYVSIDTTYFHNVIKAMELVFEPGGTAAYSHIPGLLACGKTGTAQTPDPNVPDNSIFIAFAPMNNPQIAVAVYVEHGGYGSETAAPIASLLIQKYLFDSIRTPYLYQTRVQNKNIAAQILKWEHAKQKSNIR